MQASMQTYKFTEDYIFMITQKTIPFCIVVLRQNWKRCCKSLHKPCRNITVGGKKKHFKPNFSAQSAQLFESDLTS